MKKNLLGIITLLVSVLLVGNVYAQEWDKKTYGTVSDYTQDDALKDPSKKTVPIKTEEQGGKIVTLTYDSGTFKLLDEQKNASAGDRPADYIWLGFKVTLPTNVQKDKYTVYANGEKYTDGEKGDNYYAEFLGFNVEKLASAADGTITVTFGFDWDSENGQDGVEGIDQTVIIVVKPMNITVYPQDTDTEENNEPLWSPEIAKTEVEKAEVAKVVTTEEGSKVTVSGTILPETDSVYKTMLDKMAEKGFKTVFGAYQLSIVQGDTSDGIPLVFTVGKENDGKAAYILHQKRDGSFEEFEGVVKDGVVKITVKELSPFMIALGDVVKDDAPGTNDTFPMALVGMIALGLAGTYVVKKAREN